MRPRWRPCGVRPRRRCCSITDWGHVDHVPRTQRDDDGHDDDCRRDNPADEQVVAVRGVADQRPAVDVVEKHLGAEVHVGAYRRHDGGQDGSHTGLVIQETRTDKTFRHLHTRVELRQIGVRDEAKVLGSAGACGRPVCCHTFLQGFAPVSIRMAKDQNLALNPGKLSGICGRLKCCLAYEHCLYAELKHGLPKVGGHVMTNRGPGVIRGQNILEQTVLVGLETGGQVTLMASEITSCPRPDADGRGQESKRGPGTRVAAEKQRGGRPAAGKDSRDAGAGGPNRRPRRQEPSAAGGPANGDDLSPDLAGLEDA